MFGELLAPHYLRWLLDGFLMSLGLSALACLLAFASPPAFAQDADHSQHSTPPSGHDMPQMQDMANMPGMTAQEHAKMMQQRSPSPALPSPTAATLAHAFPDLGGMDMREHMDDDPFVATLAFDRLEAFRADGDGAFAWELHGWAGYRRDRLEWRSRGERIDGDTRDGELELLWSRATSAWWNRTLGVRHDFGAGEDRADVAGAELVGEQ